MYFLGVDLGSQSDNTAIVLLQRVETITSKQNAYGKLEIDRTDALYKMHHLELVPLGTSYMSIVDRIAAIISDRRVSGNIFTIVDASGVGLPVVQMMRQRGIAPLVPISIHGGMAINVKDDGFTVPKRDLVMALTLVLQSRRLRVPDDINHRDKLIEQMQSFKVKQTSQNQDTWEAMQDRIHDDITLALSYAVWYPEKILGNRYDMTPMITEKRDLLSR